MKYTIDNYKSHFSGRNNDVLDEIRSSILDGIDLSPYISADPNQNPYTLQQIRVSLKEGISEKWLSVIDDGDILRRLRFLYHKGVNLSYVNSLVKYRLPVEYYKTLLDILEDGTPIPENFLYHRIPKTLLPVTNQALRLGLYDLRIYTSCSCDTTRLILLAKISNLVRDSGFQVVSEQLINSDRLFLVSILELFNRIDSTLWSYINTYPDNLVGEDKLQLFIDLYYKGVDPSQTYQLPYYQLTFIGKCIEEGVDYTKLLSSGDMSFSDAQTTYTTLMLNAYSG